MILQIFDLSKSVSPEAKPEIPQDFRLLGKVDQPEAETDEVLGGWVMRLDRDRGARRNAGGTSSVLRFAQSTFPIGEGFWRDSNPIS